MTALPTSSGLNWGRIAEAMAALGAGLGAAGAPSPYAGGGWVNFGPAFNQSMQGFRDQRRDRELMDLRRQEAQREQQRYEEEKRYRDETRAREARYDQLYTSLFPQQQGQYGTAAGPTPMGNFDAGERRNMSGLGHMQNPDVLKDLSAGNLGPGSGMDMLAGMNWTPQERAYMMMAGRTAGMDYFGRKLAASQTANEPYSALGKARADLNAGLIDENTYNRIVEDELRAPQGAQAPETWSQVVVNGVPMLQSSRGDLKAMPGNDNGGFGNSLDGRMTEILLSGDPSSKEYAAAYAHLAQPRVQLDPVTQQMVTIQPNLNWATPPGRMQGGQPQTAGGVGPTVANAQSLPPMTGGDPLNNLQTFNLPGATVTSSPGSGLSAGDRSKLRDVRAQAESIRGALNRFKEVVAQTGFRDRMSAVSGGLSEGGRTLNSAWTNAAIMTKADALFQLGVLNGPDLQVIQGTLPNPATVSGALATDRAYNAAIDEVLALIDSKVAAYERQFGGSPQQPPSGPSGGTRVDQLPAGNWQ